MARPGAHTDIWTDAQLMAAENPDTFVSPRGAELRALQPGAVVKIHNGQERFWVEVTSVRACCCSARSVFRGRVTHALTFEAPYDRGDTVEFEGRHIYTIKPAPAAPGR